MNEYRQICLLVGLYYRAYDVQQIAVREHSRICFEWNAFVKRPQRKTIEHKI